MRPVRTIAIAVAVAVAACGSPKEAAAPAPLVETCARTIAPSEPPDGPKPLPPRAPPSRAIVHVEMRLTTLARELDARVPPRVAEERNHDAGIAGHVNYTVDRAPFAVAVEGESLVVKTELRAHAEACARGRCYASCDPVAVAKAAVPLRLTSDYRFSPSRVDVSFVRGCEIRALGGIVKVDVTPIIAAQLGPSLRGVEREIDARMPQPRPQAERLWKELSAPRALPLGACVVVRPRGLVQGPMGGDGTTLRARFGLLASPELRTRCGEAPPVAPLPSLAYDARLPDEDDLVVGLVSPIERAMASLAPSEPFTLDGARVRITAASASPAGAALDLSLALRGEACGELVTRTPLAWSDDGRSLSFASPTLAGAPGFAPALAPEALREIVPQIASSVSDPSVTVSASIADVKPLAAFARGGDIAATVRMRGKIAVAQR